MAIAEDLDRTLKEAMRARDQQTLDVVRMLKSRLTEAVTAKGFSGAVDDALLIGVIEAYRKQVQKALPELEKAGARGVEASAKANFEIAFCERYLPVRMSEDELLALVTERIAALGTSDSRQIGRVVGDVMRTHKGRVDAADVKRLAEGVLAG